MNDLQSRVISAARTAIGFVSKLLNPPPRVTEAAERLREAVLAAEGTGVSQELARGPHMAPSKSVKRAKTILLRRHLHPIAADGLEMFAGLPGIKESLYVPRIKDVPEKHLKAAERVRRVAEEHEQELINERNYPEDFLEKLDNAVRDLEAAARVDRGVDRARYTRATEDVRDAIGRVRLAFDALDTRVLEVYLDDAKTIRLWRQASRVPKKTGRPRKRKSTRTRSAQKLRPVDDETGTDA